MITPETFLLDPAIPGTLQSRIRQMVAQGILAGRFRPGEKLPSSRGLARHLGVSRITVTLAYTELLADDYITSRGRSGYFVSDNAPALPAPPAQRRRASSVDWAARLPCATPALGPVKPADWRDFRYNFIYGQPDQTLFDSANWRLCAVQALGRRDFAALTADQFDGDDPLLVDFIARQTLPRRGILAAPDEILLTMGAQNALWLTAQVLLGDGRRAAVEDPGYPSLRAILRMLRCDWTPVPVDGAGLDPGLIPAGTQVVFVTPGHQCPTAVTMPADRRSALLARAEAEDMLIVEDDYEFTLPSDAPPLPALKALDAGGRVIHVGSFSKSLFPGLRLGYVVGPAPFIAAARALRAASLRHPPGHVQRTVAHFLSLGHYDALIRRTARAYAARRAEMHAALRAHGLTDMQSPPGGTSFWLAAPAGTDTAMLARDLRGRGVLIEPGAPFFASPAPPRRFYRLAYSSVPQDRIAEGVRLLRAAL